MEQKQEQDYTFQDPYHILELVAAKEAKRKQEERSHLKNDKLILGQIFEKLMRFMQDFYLHLL